MSVYAFMCVPVFAGLVCILYMYMFVRTCACVPGCVCLSACLCIRGRHLPVAVAAAVESPHCRALPVWM